jgi:hypothetical protein
MRVVYLVAAALTLLATPALAGGCCGSMLFPVAVGDYVFAPPADQVTQIYVVNQGPVLSGSGLYSYTNPWVPSIAPFAYPPAGYVHDGRYARPATYPYVRASAHRYCPGCGGVAPYDPPTYWAADWRYRHARWRRW